MVQIIANWFKLLETFMCAISMFHIYALPAFATKLLGSGSTVMIPSKFKMRKMIRWPKSTGQHIYRWCRRSWWRCWTGEATTIGIAPAGAILWGTAKKGGDQGFLEKVSDGEDIAWIWFDRKYKIGVSIHLMEESRRYRIARILSSNTEARIMNLKIDTSLPGSFIFLILFFKIIFFS